MSDESTEKAWQQTHWQSICPTGRGNHKKVRLALKQTHYYVEPALE
jgi:hypothetical protein